MNTLEESKGVAEEIVVPALSEDSDASQSDEIGSQKDKKKKKEKKAEKETKGKKKKKKK